jgi:hypothetical protein
LAQAASRPTSRDSITTTGGNCSNFHLVIGQFLNDWRVRSITVFKKMKNDEMMGWLGVIKGNNWGSMS